MPRLCMNCDMLNQRRPEIPKINHTRNHQKQNCKHITYEMSMHAKLEFMMLLWFIKLWFVFQVRTDQHCHSA